MVDRYVEEALDLRLVQIHGQHTVGPGRAQQIRDKLGRDGHSRLVLAILSSVSIVRDHRRDPRGGRSSERVDHHAQLNEMFIDRSGRRLHNEDIGAPDVLVDLE